MYIMEAWRCSSRCDDIFIYDFFILGKSVDDCFPQHQKQYSKGAAIYILCMPSFINIQYYFHYFLMH